MFPRNFSNAIFNRGSNMRNLAWSILLLIPLVSCNEKGPLLPHNITVNDPNLSLELIAESPAITTPIGMAIDEKDAIYILESHTHTPPDDYQGPKFDRIKKSVDADGDGIPERWTIFADSINDGMNLYHSAQFGLFLTSKMGVYRYSDLDGNGVSDTKNTIVTMVEPKNVYDHAGILGIAIGEDNWLYLSRGNVGGNRWEIQGTDGSHIEGYGDGGNVFRCKVDGSQLEEIATGFWNPFDLKFNREGRLFVTDNDPDSRGPNRLIEIVLGGDYGYKTIYGPSGLHPFSSWNGELPGTLPFSVALGEAPCAMMDASNTNFGQPYDDQMLVNVWEENNMVRIPMLEQGSSVQGSPEVFIQGDKSFHPVALATNSQGDLYMTDWVLREYPNHGQGRLWRVRSKNPGSSDIRKDVKQINRFKEDTRDKDQLITDLEKTDAFDLATTRHYLSKKATLDELIPLLQHSDSHLRLQGLLTLFKLKQKIGTAELIPLLTDENLDVRKMALVYIGVKGIAEMEPHLYAALRKNQIPTQLFETFLATVRHLQPAFMEGVANKSGRSGSIPRELPTSFIANILENASIAEAVKTMALPYLDDFGANEKLLIQLLEDTRDEEFQIALIKSLQKIPGVAHGTLLKHIAFNRKFAHSARSMAVLELSYGPDKYFGEVLALLEEEDEMLQYVAMKYLCMSASGEPAREEAKKWVEKQGDRISDTVLSVWKACHGEIDSTSANEEAYVSVNGKGNAQLGELVFWNRTALCTTCHKVKGWGGVFGPELSYIGSSKSKSQLISAILEPSLEISPEWQGWFLIDEAGNRHTGRQIDVHLNNAELMNTQGEYDTFKNPRSYGPMESSLMPEGLEKTMTPREFNDLITYLSELK